MKEVTLSPQGENSQFSEIVTLLKLLLCEMNENPSYQLTITPNPFESFLSIFFKGNVTHAGKKVSLFRFLITVDLFISFNFSLECS